MAYDRYIAICKPLHYGTIMDNRTCVIIAAAAWGITFVYAVLHTANTFSLPLCQGNVLDQFFCEIPQILKLSCSDAYLREVLYSVVPPAVNPLIYSMRNKDLKDAVSKLILAVLFHYSSVNNFAWQQQTPSNFHVLTAGEQAV
eukprot:XP_027304468.1 olfactory receptor 14C36-like [Anas platyrhynchos]